MSANKMAVLLSRIEALTKNGKIVWEQTEKTNVIQTSFTEYSLRIFKRRCESGGGYDVVFNY